MSVTNYQHRYIPSKRVTYADMGDIKWVYVEAPPALANNMGGCPISKHEFGVIATDRYVLESVRERVGLTLIAPVPRIVGLPEAPRLAATGTETANIAIQQ
jgi:hypothetical protein